MQKCLSRDRLAYVLKKHFDPEIGIDISLDADLREHSSVGDGADPGGQYP